MTELLGILNTIVLLGVLAAVVTVVYFAFLRLKRDHDTGEYHFTWAVGIVVLFLMGLAPGFVGLGLYLTVDRNYPLYWLVLCLLVVFLLLGVVGFGAYSYGEVQVSALEIESTART